MMLRWLGDLLSPPACAACDGWLADGGRAFCRACAESVERWADDGSHVAFGLFGGALAVAIRKLKYQHRPDLGRPLGNLLRRACREAGRSAQVTVPVPLHERRLVVRGYNQAALLAAHLATEMGVRMEPHALLRCVDTPPQAELGRAERMANLANAFAVARPDRIRGRSVALVDDVTTTGATLRACVHALLSAGARSVECYVVAVTPDWSNDRPALMGAREKNEGSILSVAR
jgi:ComF family protein